MKTYLRFAIPATVAVILVSSIGLALIPRLFAYGTGVAITLMVNLHFLFVSAIVLSIAILLAILISRLLRKLKSWHQSHRSATSASKKPIST